LSNIFVSVDVKQQEQEQGSDVGQAAAEAMEIGNVEALRQRLEREGTSTR